MGQVIYLDQHRPGRSQPVSDASPAFFFDLSCPLSYLTAERVERTLGEVEWVPVDARALRGQAGEPDEAELQALQARAESRARALRLPLVWPDCFPAPARRALRAAAYACELGTGSGFVLAAARLAFCGGFDLDDPETLAEAAAAGGIPLDGCIEAAGEDWRDDELEATGQGLRAHGVQELPAVRLGSHWLAGESGLMAAFSILRDPGPLARPLAPVG